MREKESKWQNEYVSPLLSNRTIKSESEYCT